MVVSNKKLSEDVKICVNNIKLLVFINKGEYVSIT
jgi:hypothetical protein